MHEVFVTNEARKDIRAIQLYFASHAKRNGWEDFIKELRQTFEDLAQFPESHALPRLPELADMGYRRTRIGRCIILYRILGTTVYVEHVFHEAQNYGRLV